MVFSIPSLSDLRQKLNLNISHTGFTLIFTISMYVICNALNIDKIAKWFYQGDTIDYSALFAYLVLGLCLFIIFFVLFAHRRTTKPLAIIMVILSASVTYFISKYNVAIDTSMVMNTIHTDSTEVSSLLSVHMIPYIIFLMLLPIAIILATQISFQRPLRHILSCTKMGVLALVIGVAFLYMEFNGIHRAGNVSNKYIVHSLVPVNYIRSSLSSLSQTVQPYFAQNHDIEITGQVAIQEDLVVVLAVGETARQKNFTLYGYQGNNTNPVLSQTPGLHMLNGIARLGSTLYALPEILEKDDIKLATMVAKMGIDTSCYVNYTLYDNCTYVGETEVTDCVHGKCYDEDVVPLLENNLKTYSSGYRFVILHLGGGSHGPVYGDRHPPQFLQFTPTCDDADVVNQCSLEQLYNSYDNTILYTDHVLGRVIDTLEKSQAPYVFMYLSDHGESLMENDRIFHGMPPGIPLPAEQAQIPLIVKSSIPVSIVKRDEYLQQDVFDTVLDLFSIETALFDKAKSFIKKQSGETTQFKTAGNNKDILG